MAKYRCPGCGIETCCLKCVNQHKLEQDCNGQRDKTAYVKLGDFTDRHLLNDYRFLEDCGRKNNNAGRDEMKRARRKPYFVNELQKQARHRNIELDVMPFPMSRRKHNSTHYQAKSRKMFWHIEWIFPHSEVTLTDKRVCEDTTLGKLLDQHFSSDVDPIMKHKLKPYIAVERENLGVFMEYARSSGQQKRFYRLDCAKTILENLQNKYVVEWPILHVVQKPDWDKYPNVETMTEAVAESNIGTYKSSTEMKQSERDSLDSQPTTQDNNVLKSCVSSVT